MAQPHLLAIPFPAQGHINPMLQLCRKLVSHGFFITFLLPMRKERFVLPEHESEAIRFEFMPDDHNELFTITSSLQTFLDSLETKLEQFLSEFIKKASERLHITCILTDLALAGMQSIALKHGICKASLSTLPASFLCISYHLRLLQERGLLHARGGGNTIIDFIPGLPPMAARDFPIMVQTDQPDDPGFKTRVEGFRIVKKDTWIFMNTFQELETMQLDSLNSNHLAIGPLLWFDEESSSGKWYSFWEEDTNCLDWLDKQTAGSVVFVSFGSLAKLSLEKLRAIYSGLRESGHPFLWVMRSDLVENVEHGQHGLKQEDVCKFVSWAPQLKVLRHPSIGAFLTHCGWNSTLEAVSCGVPILACPMHYEQRLNCALAVDHWKVGLRITHEELMETNSRDKDVNDLTNEVGAAVRDITSEKGNELRENVKRLSAAAKKASSTGTSYKNLQLFINDMRNRAANSGN